MNRLMHYFFAIAFFSVCIHRSCSAEPQSLTNNSIVASITSCFVKVGAAIDNTNVPVIGRLSMILPTAVIAFALQRFPGQTTALCAAFIAYKLFFKRKLYAFLLARELSGVKKNGKKVKKPVKNDLLLDDNFFDFDEDEAFVSAAS